MKQIEFLCFVINVLGKLEISYAVVGSYASSAWGEPRMTRDIDVIIELSGNEVAALCDAFPTAEFYVSPVDRKAQSRYHGYFENSQGSARFGLYRIDCSLAWAFGPLAVDCRELEMIMLVSIAISTNVPRI